MQESEQKASGSRGLPAEQMEAVTTAWYRLQVQNAHMLQHVALLNEINPIDLRLLKFLGVDGEPKTPKEIRRFLEIGNGNVTAMIDRLEAREFIGRLPNPDDRRSVFIQLEHRGQEVVQQLREIYGAALATIATADNREALIATANRLATELGRVAEAAD